VSRWLIADVDGLRRSAKQTKQSAKSSVRSTTSRGHCLSAVRFKEPNQELTAAAADR
jgi:hypothetical protein